MSTLALTRLEEGLNTDVKRRKTVGGYLHSAAKGEKAQISNKQSLTPALLSEGLAFGIAGAAGAQANNLIGHAAGFLASGFQAPEFRNGSFFYKMGFDCLRCTAITIGNAVIYNSNYGGLGVNVLNLPAPLGAKEASYTIGIHEVGHIAQSSVLGPLYLPTHALSQALSFMASLGNTHSMNVLERVWHVAPSY